MVGTLKKIWRSISYIGIDDTYLISQEGLNRRIFFNKCQFIGVFSMLGQTLVMLDFIGKYAYLNLICVGCFIFSSYLHHIGYFAIAKRLVVYSIFTMGTILTALSGGDLLFHIGTITVLTYSWVIFDPKKEILELLFFFGLTLFIFTIGEYNLFNAPSFINHPKTAFTRITNISGYTAIVSLFIYFIRRLNIDYEKRLKTALSEKDALLSEVLIKTKELELERNALESLVAERTAALQHQTVTLVQKNKEKEVLLKEIHHRVKNNLQIIVSLLNLQSANFKDEKTLNAFKQTQSRVISMSLVHQRMYQTSNFETIDFSAYIDLLIQNNNILYFDQNSDVTYINESSSGNIDIDTAIPMGLILNELIGNSFKYAFLETGKNHTISIQFTTSGNDHFKLTYKDNGPGLPEGFNIENSDTLGLQLIDALISQIDGKIVHINDNGAVFNITFPNPNG